MLHNHERRHRGRAVIIAALALIVTVIIGCQRVPILRREPKSPNCDPNAAGLKTLLLLLACSVDPNAIDQKVDGRSFWQRLADNFRGGDHRVSAGPTALMIALGAEEDAGVPRDNVVAVRLLLNAGAHINTADKTGRAPLAQAAYSGEYGCTELLLGMGADPNAVDKEGYTALHYAAEFRSLRA